VGLVDGSCGGSKCSEKFDFMIYLASTSPRRKQLLKKAGIRFRVLKPGYEEDDGLKAAPSRVVQVHAREKAKSCVKQVRDGIIIAADTMVYSQGEIMGKPKIMKAACTTLGKIQGRWHAVYTGVAIFEVVAGRVKKRTIFYEKTKVKIRSLSPQGIKNYFKKVNPLDKAGAYAIQSSHGGIVEDVKGLFSNAVGLPVESVVKQLSKTERS